ncbi:MAG: hypothetical protein GY924_19855, partial [Planctomycetaceae bacterium]|nr:hypothetical protein [Planctomycetaceae bacterium]
MTDSRNQSDSKHKLLFMLGFIFALISSSAHAVALKTLSELVFVVDASSSEVAVINTRFDEVVEVISLNRVANRLLVAEETGLLVAGSDRSNKVTVYTLDPFNPVADVDVGFIATHFRLSPDGKKLALNNPESGKLALMSLLDATDVSSLDGLTAPAYPTFSRKGHNLFVASRDGSKVHVVDVQDRSVV